MRQRKPHKPSRITYQELGELVALTEEERRKLDQEYRRNWLLQLDGKSKGRGNKPPTFDQFVESFWGKVDKSGECWLWTGSCIYKNASRAYGQVGWRGSNLTTHTVAFILSGQKLIEGFELLHSCDNPRCVRPDHLRSGTHSENMADARSKGRMRGPKSENSRLAKLKPYQVIDIKMRITETINSVEEMAEKYSVCKATITGIISGKTWKTTLYLPNQVQIP